MRSARWALLVLGPIGLCCLMPAGASALCYRVAGSRHAVCLRPGVKPKAMIFNVTATGTFVFERTSTGVDQNACGSGSGTTPNGAAAILAVTFDATWEHVTVPLGPVRARRVKPYAGKVDVSDLKAAWKGFAYDENCQKVTWPAHGEWCTTAGMLDPFQNELIENLPEAGATSPRSVPLYLSPVEIVTPLGFGPSCTDSGGANHAWSDAFGAGIEAPAIVVRVSAVPGKGEAAYNFVRGESSEKIEYPPGFRTNCGDPSAQLACSESWSPPGSGGDGTASVELERVAVVK